MTHAKTIVCAQHAVVCIYYYYTANLLKLEQGSAYSYVIYDYMELKKKHILACF